MKKIITYLLAAVLFLSPAAEIVAEEIFFPEEGIQHDIIIKFDSASQNWEKLNNDYSIIRYRPFAPFLNDPEFNKIYVITTTSNNAFSNIKAATGTMWAELANVKASISLEPNDTLFTTDSTNINEQWYLPKIDAPAAWNTKSQTPEVTVAVLDTGIDALHTELNDGRVIDGYKSYCDLLTTTNCVTRIIGAIPANSNSDDNGHGTAVASVIGAATNNLTGMAGITWNVKLMPIKVLGSNGSGSLIDVAEGIVWAAQNGADVINLSLSSPGLIGSTIMDVAIQAANNAGAVVVAASGNSNVNLDNSPASPVCNDGGANLVLGVAATDYRDIKSGFSNYGSSCTDLSAPGTRIVTAYFNPDNPTVHNTYAYLSGTSFSAPLVSGAAALVKSTYPSLSPEQIRQRLKNTDDISSLNTSSCNGSSCGNLMGTGRLNVSKALGATSITPPPQSSPIINPPPSSPTPTTPAASLNAVYRFWSDAHKTHFYTISEEEKNQIITYYSSSTWRFEGAVFNAYAATSGSCSVNSPVYRFWNNARSAHFYTISEKEKSEVLNNYPAGLWRFEGIAFCAGISLTANTKPVYRFYSSAHQTHFYTNSESEKDHVIEAYPDDIWKFEGVAFYAN